jgi:hypothetical protein
MSRETEYYEQFGAVYCTEPGDRPSFAEDDESGFDIGDQPGFAEPGDQPGSSDVEEEEADAAGG